MTKPRLRCERVENGAAFFTSQGVAIESEGVTDGGGIPVQLHGDVRVTAAEDALAELKVGALYDVDLTLVEEDAEHVTPEGGSGVKPAEPTGDVAPGA